MSGLPDGANLESRPPASTATLATNTWLSPNPLEVTPEFAATYLKDLRERDELYAREGLVHPGTVLRLCNWALSHNVVLGPWIHVESAINMHSLLLDGEPLEVRAVVDDNVDADGDTTAAQTIDVEYGLLPAPTVELVGINIQEPGWLP